MSKHKDGFGVSTGKPAPAEPKADPGPVNNHPGPDLDRAAEAG